MQWIYFNVFVHDQRAMANKNIIKFTITDDIGISGIQIFINQTLKNPFPLNCNLFEILESKSDYLIRYVC